MDTWRGMVREVELEEKVGGRQGRAVELRGGLDVVSDHSMASFPC